MVVIMDETATIRHTWYRHHSPKSREITKLKMVEVVAEFDYKLIQK